MQATNSADAVKHLFEASPDGAFKLYHAGAKVFETTTIGFDLYRGGDLLASFYDDTPNFDIRAMQEGDLLTLRGTATGGANEPLFKGDPDGAAELYFAGAVNLSTNNVGILIKTSAAVADLSINADTGWNIRSKIHGGHLVLQGENTATGAAKSLFDGDPDGAAELYWAGVKSFETTVGGVVITDPIDGGQLLFNGDAGDHWWIDSTGIGANINIRATNESSALKTVRLDPDIPMWGPAVDSQLSSGGSSYCWSNVYADAGVTSCSDSKYKKDIQTETLGLEFINDLVPIAFKFKKEGKRPKSHDRVYHGLLANEVEAALQNAGLEYEDFAGIEENLDDDGDRWLGLKYEQLIAPLIKAVQELSAEVETLKGDQ